MPATMTPKVTDALAYALAVGLAATCIAFAGYKVLKLRSMDNPPADMGLNYPPPKRKMTTDDSAIRLFVMAGFIFDNQKYRIFFCLYGVNNRFWYDDVLAAGIRQHSVIR